METEHTPTPLDRDEVSALEIIVSKHYGQGETAFIVRAVNCHEERDLYLRMVARSACQSQKTGNRCLCFSCEANRLIAKAEGK